MFAEMLSHTEEIIFLEAIDQYFESNPEIEPINDELNESIEQMNIKFCEKLDENENISTENESYDSSSENKPENNSPNKYLLMKDFVYINQEQINELKTEIYDNYKKQIENKNKIKVIS